MPSPAASSRLGIVSGFNLRSVCWILRWDLDSGAHYGGRNTPFTRPNPAELMYRYNDVSKRGERTHPKRRYWRSPQHLQTRSPRVIERCPARRLDPCIRRPSEREGGCRRMQLVGQPCLIPWSATSFQGCDAFGNSGSR